MINRIAALLGVMAVVAVAACATPPDRIQPVAAPSGAYASMNCDRLAEQRAELENRLADASRSQEQAAQGDAMGVFLFGVPMASMSGGDREPQIANYKGQIVELEREERRKGCSGVG